MKYLKKLKFSELYGIYLSYKSLFHFTRKSLYQVYTNKFNTILFLRFFIPFLFFIQIFYLTNYY